MELDYDATMIKKNLSANDSRRLQIEEKIDV